MPLSHAFCLPLIADPSLNQIDIQTKKLLIMLKAAIPFEKRSAVLPIKIKF